LIVAVVWALFVVAASAVVHEAGHAWTARAMGWTVVGLRCNWYGVGLVADTNGKPEQTWKVAAGGPAATGALALCFLAGTALPEPVSALFGFGFAFNAAVLVANLIPLRSLDGSHILEGLRKSRGCDPGSGRPQFSHDPSRFPALLHARDTAQDDRSTPQSVT
jgi:Zn-dependent protease